MLLNKKVQLYTFERKLSSLIPYEIKDIELSVLNGYKHHYAFYVLPNGDLLDCERTSGLDHLGVTDFVYQNIHTLKDNPTFDYLKLDKSLSLSAFHGLKPCTYTAKQMLIRNMMQKNPTMKPFYPDLERLIPDDEILSHDLGWGKIVILKNHDFNSMVVTLPNKIINDRCVKETQVDTIRKTAEIFGFDKNDVWEDTKDRNRILTSELSAIANRGMVKNNGPERTL